MAIPKERPRSVNSEIVRFKVMFLKKVDIKFKKRIKTNLYLFIRLYYYEQILLFELADSMTIKELNDTTRSLRLLHRIGEK